MQWIGGSDEVRPPAVAPAATPCDMFAETMDLYDPHELDSTYTSVPLMTLAVHFLAMRRARSTRVRFSDQGTI